MKKRIITIGSMLLAHSAFAADLTVTISNIADSRGEVLWSVFDNAENYTSGSAAVHSFRSPATSETVTLTIHDLPTGRYAIKLFHDANLNGELDSNVLGMPKEGYGFSNNGGRFGPASWDDAAFTVDGDTAIDIRVR